MSLRLNANVLAVAPIGILLVLVQAVFAAPDAPSVSGPVATFTGNQSEGVVSGIDFYCPPIYELDIENLSRDVEPVAGAPGVQISNVRPNGRNGSGAYMWNGDPGDPGKSDPIGVSVDFLGGDHEIHTTGDHAPAILANSQGGRGGTGQGVVGWFFGAVAFGGNGGAGGNTGPVTVTSEGSIQTDGAASHGILAESQGGRGGDGGWAGTLAYGDGGDGGKGGTAGAVSVTSESSITTTGDTASGIFGRSVGGAGGTGGVGGATVGRGGGSLGSGPSGTVTLTSHGTIETSGTDSDGIFAQSLGGGGGESGTGYGGVAWGSTGNSVGDGNQVDVTNYGDITTTGIGASSIYAQSVGGGGGKGSSSAGLVAIGAEGAAGGSGNIVHVENYGNLQTTQENASAIFAQSLGGGGGSGGGSKSIAALALGGKGGPGNNSDLVDVQSGAISIDTQGDRSHGIFAQSLGGGGGTGGHAVTVSGSSEVNVNVAVGGKGGGGGAAGPVLVDSHSSITTGGLEAHGIFAQSTGGGGGNGGFSIGVSGAGGISLGITIGGKGGSGNDANDVTVTGSPTLETWGDRAVGLFAQSVGGGGGNGGFSIVAAGGGGFGGGVSLGGSGAGGGDSGAVNLGSSNDLLQSTITTHGFQAYGIKAQSVGGGGGNGGFSIAAAGGGLGATAVSLGGSGAVGGNSESVNVYSTGMIDTFGDEAVGLFAQSLGGGGGDGGFSISGAGAGKGAATIGLGGSGKGGGHADVVTVHSENTITTRGQKAHGLQAQSVGGGGGSGGFSISGSGAGVGSGTISIGGSAGDGSDAKGVTVTGFGTIDTFGDKAIGLFAQSVGGGGGDGGFSVSGSGAGTGSGTFNLGGKAGGGGNGDTVLVDVDAGQALDITTRGFQAYGLLAQSVGGGGGNGGFSITGSGAGTGAGSLGIGGTGGTGGTGKTVTVKGSVTTETLGERAHGLVAQSVGGGGGIGGFSISGTGAGTGSGTFNLGGRGEGGGDGDVVEVGVDRDNRLDCTVNTFGDGAHGLFAQSVGGGGGNGGFSITGSGAGTGAASIGIGGHGGTGGDGKQVGVYTAGTIETSGDKSVGLLAQSVGKGGGVGGFSIAGNGAKTFSGNFSLGGGGGGGGTADAVTVDSLADISTLGLLSYGILAQSVGGGGGAGGFSFAGSVTTQGGGFTAGVGGSGGDAGNAGPVNLTSASVVKTANDGAHGILAQSLGGGGGAGGFSGSVSAGLGDKPKVALAIGGSGGVAGDGNSVTLQNDGQVNTHGVAAYGLFAQSVGGGGGDGGNSFSAALGSKSGKWSGSLAIGGGGAGGAAGNAGELVTVNNTGRIITEGMKSHGLIVQSVGGGGGDGGFGATGTLSAGSQGKDIAISVGGKGGAGGDGGRVEVKKNTGSITTRAEVSGNAPSDAVLARDPRKEFGNGAIGILAQSIGGGGGNGGFSFAGSFAGPEAKNVAVSVGGAAGSGGQGKEVDVENEGVIDTWGAKSHGILAQSIGGGGGNGGASVAVDFGVSTKNGANQNVAVAVGGAGGNGNIAGVVDVVNRGNILTRGTSSDGILAQSIGGGGGNGGNALSLTTSLEWAPPETGNAKQPVDISVAVGGGGGDGNHGDSVSVTNHASVITQDDESRGVHAQSIGGGGGQGGHARAIAIDLNLSEWGNLNQNFNGRVSDKLKETLKDIAETLYVAVGGSGGRASNGDAAKVVNRGEITTSGWKAYGIEAQSIGGGGGDGGRADQGLDFNWFKIPEKYHGALEAVLEMTPLRALEDLQITVGGSAGSSGNGDEVYVENYESITTFGDEASAILAQSIGGGGGIGGSGNTGLTGKIGIGGAEGASGDGGQVVVVHEGQIDTSGAGACGIQAQSVGGGGGQGGSVGRGLFDFGVGLAFARSGGGGGNGGPVTAQSTGNIITRGTGAVGIFAQSTGGGGGIAGEVGYGIGFAGSVGGPGSADTVTVNHTGNITTLGDGAHGIVAQSAAGTHVGGAVDVTIDGIISAQGVNSSGIIAQSRGDAGAGPVTINISTDSSVIGGSWDEIDDEETGVAIRIIDGANNVLTNSGLISALSGTAILAGSGNETINNSGTINGSVDLGAGQNVFDNQPNGVFETRETVQLGAENTLNNAGVLAPGGSETALHTTITGNLLQSSVIPGILDLEIGGFDAGEFDFLDIEGAATLTGGEIRFSFLPDYDITLEIDSGASQTLQFFQADSLDFFAGTVSFAFPSEPANFEYDVSFEDGGLFLHATHAIPILPATIPEPSAMMLLITGYCFTVVSIRCHRKRKK